MIQILTGRLSQSLSREVYRRMGARIAAGERAVLLVPEQQTLLAERMLIENNHLPGLFSSEVLSLRRLSQRVLEQTANEREDVLDNAGRSLLIGHLLLLHEKELLVYRGMSRHPGFMPRLCEQIAELRRLDIPPIVLQGLAEKTSGKLARKLRDIALLYAAYTDAIAEKYCDESDMLRRFLAGIPEYAPLRDAHVFVDGFESITGQLSGLLLVLEPLAATLTMTQLADAKGRDKQLFAHAWEGLRRFLSDADKAQIAYDMQPCPEEDERPEALQALSRELFALPRRPYAGDCSAIELLEAPHPLMEASQIVSLMEEALRSGRKPSDMAVLCSDMEGLGRQIHRLCAKRGIPSWLDQREEIAHHGAVRYLLAALDCHISGFARSDTLALLRSGYSGLSQDETDRLENYIIEKGIQGSMFLREFKRGKETQRQAMEELRSRALAAPGRFSRRLGKCKSLREQVLALEELLEESGIAERLTAQPTRLDAATLQEHSRSVQVWNAFCTILGRLLALLPDGRYTPEELQAMLRPALTGASIGMLPPGNNSVQISTPGHLKEDRALLFFCGLQENLFSVADEGLLLDSERAACAEISESYFGMSRESRAGRKRLDAYIALSRARERLVLSRSRTSMAGAGAPSAQLFGYVRKVFPALSETNLLAENIPRLLSSEAAGFDWMMELRGNPQKDWYRALRAHYEGIPSFARKLRAILDAAEAPRENSLAPEVAEGLYDLGRSSVSRLETFADCPYRHFVQYGLRPLILQPWEAIEAPQRGNYYHAVLEAYTAQALSQGVDFAALSRQDCEALVREASRQVLAEAGESAFEDSPLMQALLEDMTRTVSRTAWLASRQWGRSQFRPYGQEWIFGERGIPGLPLALPDGREALLRGRIDRLDILAEPPSVVVVDYKSGSKALALEDIHEGVTLQLPLYLASAAKILFPEKTALPAGMLYMAAAPSPIEIASHNPAEIAEEWERGARPKGFLLGEETIVESYSRDPGYLGISATKSGAYSKNAPLLSGEDMRLVLRHAQSRAGELLGALGNGVIEANPLQSSSERSACSYCDYSAICGFDGRYESPREKEWQGRKEEILEKMREEEEHGDTVDG